MKLEEIITQNARFTIEDFEYMTRPNHSAEEQNNIKTIEAYINNIMPEFWDQSKNKIDVLRPLIEESNFHAIEKIYDDSLKYFLKNDPSIAKFNVIFGFLVVKAAEKTSLARTVGEKITYDIWKTQNSEFAEENVWSFLEYGLPLVIRSNAIQKKNSDGLEIYDYLCPEYILYCLILVYSKRETAVNRDEPSDKELSEMVLSIGNIKNSKDYLCEKYWDSESDLVWGDLKPVFERALIDIITEFDGDNIFISRLGQFLATQGKIHKITIHDLITFSTDYLRSKRDLERVSKEIIDLSKQISAKVIGQDMAVRKFINGYFNGMLRDQDHLTGPEGCYLFVGPPGVGKTYLAQTAAGLLGRPSKIYNMSEYSSDNDYHDFVGFHETWRDAKEGDLTKFVSENYNAVLIFDEIEKAHITTIRLFLSILEGGYLTDLFTHQNVDFTHTIVIFTTNAGRQFYEEKRGMSISSLPETTLVDALKSDKRADGNPLMPSEILSRLSKGNIVGFDHMSPGKLIPIIKSGMNRGAETLEKMMGVQYQYDDSLLPFLFMYHMGGNLDARVAASRSESFIKDILFHIAERIGEDIKEYSSVSRDKNKAKLYLAIEENDVAEDLTKPEKQFELMMICNDADINRIPETTTVGKCTYHIQRVDVNNENDDYKATISGIVENQTIDAILVDPLIMKDTDPNGEELIGINHKNTIGNRVLQWLLEQKRFPLIYCVEFEHQRISYFDQLDLYQKGIKGIIRFSEAEDDSEKETLLGDLCYELFLTQKMNEIMRKGKILEFDVGHRIEQDQDSVVIRLFLRNFDLVRAMNSEGQEIFLDDESRAKETFDSVIGCESAKEELKRFVKFINDPEYYRKSGQQVSKGILMYGPPGTGKTKLARVMACEADCPFISVTGAEFVQNKNKMAEVFRLARMYAPSIVFIDEIESFAVDPRYGRQETVLLKQLLTEMDGFDQYDMPVFVIAATNAAKAPNLGEKNIYLDDALLRRFTKKVYMPLPGKKERIEFINIMKSDHAGREFNLNNLTEQDIEGIANGTVGITLAEISNVINIAISRAAEKGENITKQDLMECFEEFVYGEKDEFSPDFIWKTAVHEAGHAFMAFYCNNFNKGHFTPEYATIIARGGYLGLVSLATDESAPGNHTRDDLRNRIRVALAGRATEIVFEGETKGLTTGASNDLRKSTAYAARMLSEYGMEEGFLAAFDPKEMMQSPLAHDYYSKLNSIVQRELEEAIKIIKQNKDKVNDLARSLCEKSKLDANEILDIINPA